MTEVDAMEFYQKVTDESEKPSKQYKLTHRSNAELVVDLYPVDRKLLLDEISRLPDEMLSTLSEAEDEDEAQEMAEQEGLLSGVNGDTILAFENICAESMSHDDLTTHNFEHMVTEFDFEVLFEIGSAVIEMSFEDGGSIKDFQEVDSDKNY